MDDIDMVVCYFILNAIEKPNKKVIEYRKKVVDILKTSTYIEGGTKINLLDYCNNHICMKHAKDGVIVDPIQIEKIDIDKFKTKQIKENSVDLTHNESVDAYKFKKEEERYLERKNWDIS